MVKKPTGTVKHLTMTFLMVSMRSTNGGGGEERTRDLSSSNTVSEVLEEDGDLVDLLAHLGLDGSGRSSGSGKKVVGIGLIVDVETTLIFILVLLEDENGGRRHTKQGLKTVLFSLGK